MNWWEQFALGLVITLLHQLKVDPSRVPVLNQTLTVIYDGIGELMGWPPHPVPDPPAPPATPGQPDATPQPPPAPPAPPRSILP